MNETIAEPVKGHALRAAWGADVTRTLNEHTQILSRTGAPKIENRRAPHGVTPPFTVRFIDDAAAWCIYIPPGAVAMNAVTAHLVEVADSPAWYKIAGAAAFVSREAVFDVYVHVKARAMEGENDFIHPLVTASAHEVEDGVAAVTDASCAGDVFTACVARGETEEKTVTDEQNNNVTVYTHGVQQYFTGALTHLSVPTAGVLELYWKFPADKSEAHATACTQASRDAAPVVGVGTVVPAATLPATGEVTAYYVIDCTGEAPTAAIVTTRPTQNLYAKLVYILYRFKDARLVYDGRATLAERPFYP